MNWDDPAARLALIEQVGVEEYNRRIAEHFRQSTIAVVNGHLIRPVESSRFGLLYLVSDTGTAFAKFADTEKHASTVPKGTPT